MLEVESKRRDILVTQASGAKPPAFGGDGSPPADEVVAEMRRIYQDVAVPRFLDATAIELLTEARGTFGYLGLREYNSRRHEDHILLFPWVGGRAQMALVLALAAHDIHATSHGLAVVRARQRSGSSSGRRGIFSELGRTGVPSREHPARPVFVHGRRSTAEA